MKSRSTWLYLLPAITILAAFFVLPVVRLIPASVSSESGLGLYLEIITNPRYSTSVLSTIVLSVFVTLASLFVGGLSGLFLERHRFWGRDAVVGLITLPLSFPGVVVGFMIIMLGGRNGLIGMFTQGLGAGKLVFAYGMAGLFLGYLYFSIPRVVTTVMAAAKKMDPMYEEAARTLGASSFRILKDVTLPALAPALFPPARFVLRHPWGPSVPPLRLRPTSMFCRSRFTRNLRFRPTSPLRQCFLSFWD